MRILLALAIALPGALGAQASKSAAPKSGPITAGGSSTARTASPAPPSAASIRAAATPAMAGKPGAAPLTPSGKPTAVASAPATSPASPKSAPATGTPAPGAKAAAVAAAGVAAAAATKGTAAPAKSAPAPAVVSAAPAIGSAAAATPANAQAAAGASITIDRELFHYERGGRRDPYGSLLQSDELKPAVSDLKLIGVVLDPRGRNSIAVMRDLSTKELYRVRPGQSVGRLRVTQINQRSVTFLIEEFGATRQETLSLRDSTTARTP